MKILITGAAGRLGSAVRHVARNEHQLILLDQSESISAIGGIRADLSDRDALDRAVKGCDAIIHTAALHGAFYGKRPNADFIRANVLGSEYLFDAAIRHGVKRLAIASSMEILVGINWAASGPVVLDESRTPCPDWIYPVTKRQIEILGSFYARHHGLEVVQLRYMGFGSMDDHDIGLGLLAHTLSTLDAARATLLAATNPGLKDEILHIGPDTPLTQKDIVDALKNPNAVLERHWPGCTPFLQKQNLTPLPEQFWPVARIDRAKLVLGWKPLDTFESFLNSLGWKRA
ncbi:MAG: NAD(P)-dependent oxidoreductase [Phycisphaerales bacterium]|nr:NAD(P)-dependent oxidoreductase [Phycisphaerales bacterium]